MEDLNSIYKTQNSILQSQIPIIFLQMLILNSIKHNFSTTYTYKRNLSRFFLVILFLKLDVNLELKIIIKERRESLPRFDYWILQCAI